ncbi:MAG: mandelate racemase/muconate lactonizing enzyme family protein [Bryobacterales bacterium]|nr:mandelate racemase/muconate lactonizing enzyme family protein [Bryobacterales bacterium]
MNRRTMLSALAGALPAARLWGAGVSPGLKITRVETVYWKSRDEVPWWPHWTWVRLHTNEGVFGMGETYPRNETEATLLHSAVARGLLGKHPGDIERIWKDLYVTFDFQITGGAEMRVLSAIDLALWDLLGKTLQTPVYRLIGGKSNPRVRLYNTCFPYKYDFLREPEKIMGELIEQRGIRAIKVWPFDGAARRHGGQFITSEEIEEALTPVRKLRDAFGDKIEILIEFHSLWNLTSAIRIAKALEPYHPMWLEDMLLPGNFAQYRRLAESTSLGLTAGERMAGKMQFQSFLESRTPRYVMFDVCWCGGLTEARKITAMADAYELPFAPHTAGGPLLFHASTHLSTAMTNCWIQESCQRFYEHDWPAMLVNPLMPKEGAIEAPEEPGFGMTVKPEVWSDKRAVRRVTEL